MDRGLDRRNEWFECCLQGSVAVVRLLGSALEMGADLAAKDEFFAAIDSASASRDVRAHLFLNAPSAFSESEYAAFLDRTLRRRQESLGTDQQTRDLAFLREENALTQSILKIQGLQKPTVVGLKGGNASPFLGAALACDVRLALEDTVFTMHHAQLGMPPDGALGFYLPRYVGVGKAADLLYSGETISATKAYDLGLVNEVVPEASFDVRCVERAAEMGTVDPLVFACTKALLYPHREGGLEAYLERQQKIMYRIMTQQEGARLTAASVPSFA